jgi:ubiquinone/menaquinone biosynthesis C-methylase UbiE
LFFCPQDRFPESIGTIVACPQDGFAVKTLLRFFFRLLYHQFAFTYDLVASVVSLGRWKDWVLSVVPFVEGDRVLEIGHGPGHLQRALLERDLPVVGIDESSQMGRLAKHNLRRYSKSTKNNSTSPHQSAYTKTSLTRGLSQHLPFPGEYFNTLFATFPAEYIFDPRTLVEAHRVLTPNGRFVILPGATILGRSILDRMMALLFRITGQTPPDISEMLHEKSKEHFAKSGFHIQVQELDIKSSRVYILLATKIPE